MKKKLLVDTNSYLRLADGIKPLLDVTFGEQNYCLYILPDLDKEFNRNPRLQTKFPWFYKDEYKENRKCKLKITTGQLNEIENVYDFILDYSKESEYSASKVDIKCLTYGYVLNIPIVTDDECMHILGREYDIKTIKTLELLKIMLDCKKITIKNVHDIVKLWAYNDDLPKDFFQDYKNIFSENAVL
ncbi:MAG: DNA-binding protein [Spirochaetes bacterium]|nr:DNA-binding protein [Spirochaetota bacterium]